MRHFWNFGGRTCGGCQVRVERVRIWSTSASAKLSSGHEGAFPAARAGLKSEGNVSEGSGYGGGDRGRKAEEDGFVYYVHRGTPSGSPAIRLVLNDDRKLVRQLEAVGFKIMKVFSGFALAGARGLRHRKALVCLPVLALGPTCLGYRYLHHRCLRRLRAMTVMHTSCLESI